MSYPPLSEQLLADDPIVTFLQWLRTAERESGMENPNAMTLSTVGEDGYPQGRIVLLKGLDDGGFAFYTNRLSPKARALQMHPYAALTFHWDTLGRQVRVVGQVEDIDDGASDVYFSSRDRGSQIGAWASSQSAPLESRQDLEERVRALAVEYDGRAVPRPPHWGGYRVIPRRIEFWQQGAFRLHDRFLYTWSGDGWGRVRLSP